MIHKFMFCSHVISSFAIHFALPPMGLSTMQSNQGHSRVPQTREPWDACIFESVNFQRCMHPFRFASFSLSLAFSLIVEIGNLFPRLIIREPSHPANRDDIHEARVTLAHPSSSFSYVINVFATLLKGLIFKASWLGSFSLVNNRNAYSFPTHPNAFIYFEWWESAWHFQKKNVLNVWKQRVMWET